MTQRPRDGTAVFASVAVAGSAITLAATVAIAAGWGPGSNGVAEAVPPVVTVEVDTSNGAVSSPAELSNDGIADPQADPDDIMQLAARAMAAVTSVEFRLEREGAPVFVDQFERIALDRLHGQFTIPNQAQAELTVTVNNNLVTKLGAVAIDDEVWISNPVTGDFETLPSGYDIDPSRFFDPENGWQPLLANMTQVELVAIEDRDGERYHVRGIAAAEQVRDITVGLVRDQDVTIDLWIQPGTDLVTAAEFTTIIDGNESNWMLELDNYGDEFTISPPQNVRG